MVTLVPVCATSDVAPGTGKTVSVQGKELAVFNVDGTFHVLDNECPHRGGPLGEGELEGCLLTCPWHAWQFDVRTGDSVTDDSKVAVYPCTVEGGQVLVTL
jgi:3-phenylpropionate/trans-cinnamate dioxygenase ferredoxin component